MSAAQGGMSIPEPGGTMKKMQFEFTDPAEAAQQAPSIPPGAGVLPAGAQQAPAQPSGMQPQPGMQPPAEPSQPPAGGLWGGMAGNADQFGQGPDSSMFTDDMLQGMLQDDPMNPIDLQADQMQQGLDGGDPELQMRMMEAARRQGGF